MLDQPPTDIVDQHRATIIEVGTDTCDHCGPAVRAYVYAQMRNGTLAYCGSCATRYWPNLTQQAIRIIDQRDTILP